MSRAQELHQARVYLTQARATRFRWWKVVMVEWAGNRRRKAMAMSEPVQADLFGGE